MKRVTLEWGFQTRHRYQHLRKQNATKKISLFFKILKFSIISWAPFWAPFWDPGFFKLFCGLCLTTVLYPYVSTTFPASFFTVMPKGLTTGPKSMSDYSGRITTYITVLLLMVIAGTGS
jgi:hypothetical protein